MFNKKSYDQDYYQAHKGEYQDYNKQRRLELKKKLFAHFAVNPCVDCKETDPVVLEFDHEDGRQKDNEIMRMVHACYSWQRIEKELAKCVVRCANCHRKRTFKQFGYAEWRFGQHHTT